jgi:hypothetical protein
MGQAIDAPEALMDIHFLVEQHAEDHSHVAS